MKPADKPTEAQKPEVENQKPADKPTEAKVFHVEGYGNVNGCKTQAEAKKKAAKIIKSIRG